MDNDRAFASHRATLASPQAPTGLGHSEGIANAESVIQEHDMPTPSFEDVAQNLVGELEGRYRSSQADVVRLKGFLAMLFVNAEKAPDMMTPDVVKFFASAALNGFSEGRAFEKWNAQSGSVHESAVHAPKTNKGTDNG